VNAEVDAGETETDDGATDGTYAPLLLPLDTTFEEATEAGMLLTELEEPALDPEPVELGLEEMDPELLLIEEAVSSETSDTTGKRE
jgi:hypothetical protein